MAGAAGFEPAHGGIKSRCLTAWRRPILMVKVVYSVKSRYHQGVMMRVLLIFLFVGFMGFAVAEERLLTGDEVREWLSDTSVTADGWSQTFSANGDTFHIQSGRPPSPGRWRVQGSQYCSLWPPSGDWACYDVYGDETSDGRIIIWESSSGYREPARIDD